MLTRLSLVSFLCLSCATVHAGDLVLDARPVVLKPQSSHVTIVPLITEPVTLDGKLDEPGWKTAGVIANWLDFTNGGVPTGLEAQVRVMASKEFLYVACTQHGTKDLELTKPSAGPVKDEYDGSVLEMFFDPNADGKTKVQIVTNPLGLRYDAFDSKPKWNGTWKSAGQVGDDQWTIEVAIPCSEMNNKLPGEVTMWKANFGIYFRREGEQMNSWTGGWGSPATDYGTLYFGTKAQYEAALQPKVDLFLDRVVYDLRDNSAIALVRVQPAGHALDKLALQLSVRQGDKAVTQQTLAKLPEADGDVDCTIDLRALPAGDYTLRADVLENGKTIATYDRAFGRQQRKVQPEPVTAGKIPIKVHPQQELGGTIWPITTGVPFAQGSLTSPENVRLLDPAGKEVPVQTQVRSTWDRRGPVQWLGLDFIPTLSDKPQDYTLEYGPQVKSAAGASSLKVQETPDLISVNTGPLQFTVNRKQFALISSATIAGKEVIKPTPGAVGGGSGGSGGLSLVDNQGTRYTSVNDAQVQVTIEEQGPVRATICAKGWYVKEGSKGERTSVELPTDRLCLFTVRLSAFAGSPLVKMSVSTTMTQDTDKVRLRELTIGLPLQARDIRVGADKLADGGYLLQDRWDRSVDAAGKEHARVEGWIETPDLRIGVRRFWQLFPKEIGYAKGVLTIHPWPAHGRDTFAMDEQVKMENIYKLWFAHQGREQDFKLPPAYTKRLDDELVAKPKTFSAYYKDMSFSNAQGLTIHNDLVLAFGSAVAGPTLSKLANIDPHALPDSAYLCGTNVLGPILHADPQFAELENTYKRGFLHFARRQEANNEYGMLIFGNWHTYWNYGGKSAGIHRVWGNNHYQIPNIPLLQYARSGDPAWIETPGGGRDLANVARDVATIGYVSPERRFQYHLLGAMYHVKGFAPWAGDAHVAAHPICASYLINDYYLFGNRRSLDTLQNWVAGIKEASPGGFNTREGMTTMGELIEACRLTWDPALVELIERFRLAILRQPMGDPEYPSWDYHPTLCARDYAFSGDPKMLQAFRDLVADRDGRTATGVGFGGTMHYDSLFAGIDHDATGLARWTPRFYASAISVVDRPEGYVDGMVNELWYPYAYHVHKYPYVLKAFKDFGLKLQRPDLTRPAPVAVGEGKSLIVVQETTDQAIPVTIAFVRAPESQVSARVIRADGTPVAEGVRPVSKDSAAPLTLTIPSDGQATQYLIEIRRSDEYELVLWPVTPLVHEMALIPTQKEILWNPTSGEGLRLYTAPPTAEATQLKLRTRSSGAMALQLLDAKGKELGRVTSAQRTDDTITLDIPAQAAAPLSLYITGEARLTLSAAGAPWPAALTTEALFVPKITQAP